MGVDDDARAAAISIVSEWPSASALPTEWMWWPVLLWIQFGRHGVDGLPLARCVTTDPCLAALLQSPLPLTSAMNAIQQWLIGPVLSAANYVIKWLNVNKCMTNQHEFFMARIYHLMRRSSDVVMLDTGGFPVFGCAEASYLMELVRQSHRVAAVSVYAFAMLILNGGCPVATQAIDHWLGDDTAYNWDGVYKCVCVHTVPLPTVYWPFINRIFCGPWYLTPSFAAMWMDV